MHQILTPAQRRSDTAALRFGWASFAKIAKSLLPLWKRHWEEIALDRDTIPLRPHFESYYAYDVQGSLRILAARDARTGELVGYCFNLLGPHLHYTVKTAHTEMFWLAPEHRRGWNGVRMLFANKRGLRQMGVEIHTISFKIGFEDGRVGKLLQRLGYKPVDIVMKALL